MVAYMRPFFDKLHVGISSDAGFQPQKTTPGSNESSFHALQRGHIKRLRSLYCRGAVMRSRQGIKKQIAGRGIFVTTTHNTTNQPWRPPDRIGSYGAYTPPIGSNDGSIESPRPPLSTGATGAAGAINKGIRFHRWWWCIIFASSSSMVSVIYGRDDVRNRIN